MSFFRLQGRGSRNGRKALLSIPKPIDRKSVPFGIIKAQRKYHIFVIPKSRKIILEYLKIILDIYEYESYNGYINEQQ